jgi:hypothetical protein
MDAKPDLADMDKLWSDLLDDALDASQRQLVLTRVTADFNAAIVRGPESGNLMTTLGRIFRERPLTEDMWVAAQRAFSIAYGHSAVQLIGWLVDDSDQIAQRLDEIAPMLEVRSESLLREVLTRHAEDLGWSAYAWNNSAEEWRTINIDRVQSLDGRNYFMRLTVDKVNGDRIAFESRANQLLLFTRAILDTLNALPSAAFTAPRIVESFLEQARRIVDTLSASPSTSQPQDGVGLTDELRPAETAGSPINDGAGD